MADTPYTDASARAILQIFAHHNRRAGEAMTRSALQISFLKNQQYRAEDYVAGLSYAIEKEWVIADRTMIKLTEAGFHEL